MIGKQIDYIFQIKQYVIETPWATAFHLHKIFTVAYKFLSSPISPHFPSSHRTSRSPFPLNPSHNSLTQSSLCAVLFQFLRGFRYPVSQVLPPLLYFIKSDLFSSYIKVTFSLTSSLTLQTCLDSPVLSWCSYVFSRHLFLCLLISVLPTK